VFGSREATECGLAYYPRDKVLFASDAPFDPEKGPMYIRETIKIVEQLPVSPEQREQIFWRNAAKLLKVN
jgi:aminocarboxymuconate-semialdehyde decarboxylase